MYIVLVAFKWYIKVMANLPKQRNNEYRVNSLLISGYIPGFISWIRFSAFYPIFGCKKYTMMDALRAENHL